MAQTLGNSTELNERPNSAPESGSEISDMASSRELGIEVESQSHEDNQDPPVLPECVEVGESLPEGSRVVIGFPGKGLGKRPNIHATKKTNKKRRTFEAAKDSRDQGDEMINVEVDHIDNEPPHTESFPILNETIHDEPPHTESPPILKETIHDETPPPLLKIFKPFKKGRHLNMIQWDKI
ncbi:hypothetical protein O181_067442 [Austropuccinia psidii MF-1]|uniref:Uncharacterized protein n=1 Tax=Austropuccinia psidii MF-1 TaxID=1389203 RepID=A0A9Q3I5A0_9BASI|nr:hypothetical protein [Austropuccinia psidii MF-1]